MTSDWSYLLIFGNWRRMLFGLERIKNTTRLIRLLMTSIPKY